ncbi:MAG: SLC13 family permease [Pirellulales bacterium]
MSFEAWMSIAVSLAVMVLLQRRHALSPDVLFLGGLVVVTLCGALTPEQALAGFANTGVLMVGALFVVAAGLRDTGVLDWVGMRLLGRVDSESVAMRRIAATVPVSGFLPNTPVVAMLLPVVVDWCRKRSVSPSRLLIPLSYFSILGGCCTLIGTSTNVVANGLLKDEYRQDVALAAKDPKTARYEESFRNELRPMTLFEIGKAGIPCALVGTGFLLLFARRILPERQDMVKKLGDHRREYLVEMLVRPECRLCSQTVEAAGLRHLPGLFLIEINRQGDIITPVTPQDTIHAGDRLVFTGVVTTIVDLERIPGLVPAADMAYEFRPNERQQRRLTEAVLSPTSPLIGNTVRRANFRGRYGAAVVAVHRNGQQMQTKIGDIQLEPGDTLLLQTRTDFAESFQNSPDFYLVSSVDGYAAMRHDRAWLSTLLVVGMVVWMGLESIGPKSWAQFTNPALAAITVAALMVVTRCLPASSARSALDLQVLVTIAAALGLGKAIEVSGAAKHLAAILVDVVGPNPYVLLVALYVMALVFTEMLSNAAVVAMLFPICLKVALAAHMSPRPLLIGVTLAASLSFLTPLGYQTNLMVMGPGGYRPSDFFRVGWPLTLLVTITALVVIPIAWPF